MRPALVGVVSLVVAAVVAGCGGGGVGSSSSQAATVPTAAVSEPIPPMDAALPGRRGLIAVVVVAGGANPTHRIDVITPAGRFVRRLPCLSGGRCIDADPAWSPDGQRLAYTSESRGKVRLVTVRVDGSAPRVLITADPANTPAHPTWAPSGRRIAFVQNSFRFGNEIFTVGRDGAGLRRIGRGVRGEFPVWSVSGRIAVGGYGTPPGGGIRTFRARDGRDLRRLTGGDAVDPDWSPGAKRIAYTRCVDCGRRNLMQVWIMRADGTAKRRLSDGAEPAWSPDARLIVFARGDGLSTVPAGGGTAQPLAYTPPGFGGRPVSLHAPAWQPLPR